MEFFRQEYWSGLPCPSPGSFPDSGITPRSPALKTDSLPSEWPAAKKAEHWRTDAFELWFWRRLLRVLWIAKRPNQSILKEISPEYFLEGLTLKFLCSDTLATLCEELTRWKRPRYWDRLMAGAEENGRLRQLGSITDSMNMSLSKFWVMLKDREAWHAAVNGVTKPDNAQNLSS